MAVNPEYKAYVLDQLAPLGPVTARAMFGGAGIYLDGVMFALITRADVLYFRTGDANRGNTRMQKWGRS
jgi:DNA transformation protein